MDHTPARPGANMFWQTARIPVHLQRQAGSTVQPGAVTGFPDCRNFTCMDDKLYMQVDEYISNLLAPVDDVLGHAERAMHAAGMPMINVSPVQGKLLQVFAKMCRAKTILELGTLGGYS